MAKELTTFGGRLAAAREMRGATQFELGGWCTPTMPESQVAHYETNSRAPSLENLIRLALALRVTTDSLCGLE